MKVLPGQSIASRPVADLAAVPVTGPLMRRKAGAWAAGLQSRNRYDRGAEGVRPPERSILGDNKASRSRDRRDVGLRHVLKWTPQQPGRPSAFLGKTPGHGGPATSLRRAVRCDARPAGVTSNRAARRTKSSPRGKDAQGKTGGRLARRVAPFADEVEGVR